MSACSPTKASTLEENQTSLKNQLETKIKPEWQQPVAKVIYPIPTFPVRPVCAQHHAPKPPKCPCSLPIERMTVITREVPVEVIEYLMISYINAWEQ